MMQVAKRIMRTATRTLPFLKCFDGFILYPQVIHFEANHKQCHKSILAQKNKKRPLVRLRIPGVEFFMGFELFSEKS